MKFHIKFMFVDCKICFRFDLKFLFVWFENSKFIYNKVMIKKLQILISEKHF